MYRVYIKCTLKTVKERITSLACTNATWLRQNRKTKSNFKSSCISVHILLILGEKISLKLKSPENELLLLGNDVPTDLPVENFCLMMVKFKLCIYASYLTKISRGWWNCIIVLCCWQWLLLIDQTIWISLLVSTTLERQI